MKLQQLFESKDESDEIEDHTKGGHMMMGVRAAFRFSPGTYNLSIDDLIPTQPMHSIDFKYNPDSNNDGFTMFNHGKETQGDTLIYNKHLTNLKDTGSKAEHVGVIGLILNPAINISIHLQPGSGTLKGFEFYQPEYAKIIHPLVKQILVDKIEGNDALETYKKLYAAVSDIEEEFYDEGMSLRALYGQYVRSKRYAVNTIIDFLYENIVHAGNVTTGNFTDHTLPRYAENNPDDPTLIDAVISKGQKLVDEYCDEEFDPHFHLVYRIKDWLTASSVVISRKYNKLSQSSTDKLLDMINKFESKLAENIAACNDNSDSRQYYIGASTMHALALYFETRANVLGMARYTSKQKLKDAYEAYKSKQKAPPGNQSQIDAAFASILNEYF